ncbi:MAG: glycosyltransferase family 2 protein [Lachnospiraceae bacterium]|nr:glycosyltransferase family 2 protein [Lachnospiraceae bacterium]MBR4412696.1 glycosyltransferase family 2 protein [Lachnospiraceae bacterium]MBR5067213.1 glycosyltransferase family 2 protein [Lachnospiraceae bacterium]MBR5917827.1 glycosyltransferase family 2 protein [Lachnospiraceae bacterium]
MDILSIIVPCYNEEEMLPITFESLRNKLSELIEKGKISSESFLLFVDDGSKDKTWELIENENKIHKEVRGLKLAGNVGHQFALTAGLIFAKDICDISISIDADLQDDIDVFEEMVDKFHEGNDIVYGVRNKRKTDSIFKRVTAQTFYRVMNFFGAKTIYNHADFRLMSKRALEQFSKYSEENLYLRGIVPLIGYKTECVYYDRKVRVAGKSKYPLRKMLALAIEGITSFSVKPIRYIVLLGFLSVFLSIAAFVYALVSYFLKTVEPGWTSLIVSIWFLGGVQLISIGLIGEYIGKIYMEVKRRPRYNIEKYTS